MKKLLAFLLLIVSVSSFSQNLKLFGKVEWHNLKETGKIYWTEEGNDFDAKKFITYDKNKKFNFTISINKIKSSNIKALVFAMDTTQKGSHSCTQTINVLEIVNSSEFKNLKNIALKTDLILAMNCTSSPYYDAAQNNKDKFVGSYNLTVNDTLRNIELHNLFFLYNSQISKQTKNHMNEEFGSWGFNNEKKILSLYIEREMNNKYGLVLSKKKQIEFIVNDTSGNMIFQSKEGVLTKK